MVIALGIPVAASRCFGVVEAFRIAGIGGFYCSKNFSGFDLGFTSFFLETRVWSNCNIACCIHKEFDVINGLLNTGTLTEAPKPYSQSSAASETIVGPSSSIGRLAIPRLPDQATVSRGCQNPGGIAAGSGH